MPLPSVFRSSAVVLAMSLGGSAGLLQATAQVPASPNTPPVVATADGGTRETLESIFIPPKANAPFSLVLETEWAKPMFGGGSYTVANSRRIMRDSGGRIYQERWLLAPKGSKIPSIMNLIQIADPNAGTLFNCFTGPKRCDLLRYNGSTTREYKPMTHPSGPLPGGEGVLVHEDLGESDVAGLPVKGTRETITIAAGANGNDQPMVSVREFWYSAQLGVNLRSRLEGPAMGRQVFTVTELTTQEPETRFFALPEGFTVVDHRSGPAEE